MRRHHRLNEKDLESSIAGGFDAVEAGVINAACRSGFMFMDNPPITVEKGEGTKEKPEIRTYGSVGLARNQEVSMTAIPRSERRLDYANQAHE